MQNSFVRIFALVLLVTPFVVSAGPIIRSGDSVSVGDVQTLKGDFYGFGQQITLSGPAENDVFLAGQSVTINAPIAQDLLILGDTINVHGDVGDDVRVLGGSVTIGNTVKGDVVVVGGTLTILSTATIEGDVIFKGGDLVVEGEVVGGLHSTSNTTRIDAKVGGDVLVTAHTQLSFGERSEVLGNVTYESLNDIVRAQNAVIIGDIHRNTGTPEDGKEIIQLFVFIVGVFLFAALALYLLARTFTERLCVEIDRSLGYTGLIGVGIFLIVPFVSVILMVSVVGLLIGAVLLLLYVLLLLLALTSAGILLGYGVQRVLFKKKQLSFFTVCVGVAIFCLLPVIPVVGGIVGFAVTVLALGSIGKVLFQAIRS